MIRSSTAVSGPLRLVENRARGPGLNVVAVVVSLQLLGSACATQKNESTPKPTPEVTPLSDELVDAMENDGVRGAARLVRHFVDFIPLEDDDVVSLNVDNLCRSSELVVLAKVIRKSPGPYQDGDRFITTSFSMVVDESFQGGRAPGDTITVVMSGGFIQFPDGATALQRSERGLSELQIGGSYVLFLQHHERRPDHYRSVAKEEGVFALDGGRVFSRARAGGEIYNKYHGMKADDFLSLVRSATCK